jgi:hypothetical protein
MVDLEMDLQGKGVFVGLGEVLERLVLVAHQQDFPLRLQEV